MKSCVIKQQFVEMPCPNCDLPIRNCDMSDHVNYRCHKRVRGGRNPNSATALSNWKLGGHSACAVCGRKFAADRLLKHQAICRRNSNEHRAPLKNIASVVDALAEPINSNWRTKRDEMKRRIGASKSESKARHTDVMFELVLKPMQGECESALPAWFSPDCAPPIHDVPVVLDDSLDDIKEKPISAEKQEADCIESIRSLVVNDGLSYSDPEKLGSLTQPSTIQPREGSIVSAQKEATAWTIEWPGRKSSQPKPTMVADGKSVIAMDPRARLEPVRFEFQPQLSRTKSSYSIPTTPDLASLRPSGNVLQPLRENIQAISYLHGRKPPQFPQQSGELYYPDNSQPNFRLSASYDLPGKYASSERFAHSIRFNYGDKTLCYTVHISILESESMAWIIYVSALGLWPSLRSQVTGVFSHSGSGAKLCSR